MRTWAHLAGALGAATAGMAALSAIVLGGRFSGLLLAQAIAGLLGLAFFFFVSGRDLGTVARGRGATFVLTSVLSTAALLALAIFGVRAAARARVRIDLTREQIFTLAPDSIAAAKAVAAPTTLLAFLAPSGTPAIRLESLVERYQEHTSRLTLRLIDPARHPDLAERYGVNLAGPRLLLEQGPRRERIEVVGEEALTVGLRRLEQKRARKIYFSTGHGEAALDDATSPRGLDRVKAALAGEGYEARTLELGLGDEIPQDATVLIVAGPKKAFLAAEVQRLQRFLDRGGRLMVLLDPGVDAGLDALLAAQGVGVGDDLLLDPSGIGQRMGTGPTTVVISRYARHPITERFDLAVIFPTTRSLWPLSVPGTRRPVPLALSASSAWAEKRPGVEPRLRDEDERGGPLPVLLVVRGEAAPETGGGTPTNNAFGLAVAGDSEWIGRRWFDQLGNRDLFLNLLAWLSDRGERITLRPRRRGASSLFLTVNQGQLLRLLTVDALPLLLLGLGILVAARRRR